MEDDLNFSGNGRHPQFQEMEDNLNFSGNGRRPQFSGNGRQPKFFRKWKTTSTFHDIEEDLSCQKIEDHLNSISADTKYF